VTTEILQGWDNGRDHLRRKPMPPLRDSGEHDEDCPLRPDNMQRLQAAERPLYRCTCRKMGPGRCASSPESRDRKEAE
jgi:hypothetical protein